MIIDFLKKSFLLIILLSLILYVAIYKPTIFHDLEVRYFPAKPCSAPIQYKIGTFDTRFGISKTDFLKTLVESSTLWDKPLNKKLFEYNPKGSLTVNLVYDTRQQSTQQNATLQNEVNQTRGMASSVKVEYLALEDKYRQSEQSYQDEVNTYKISQSKYNADVAYWNSVGGAPKSEYESLNAEKNNLLVLQQALENRRVEVNGLANQVNVFIAKYNTLVSDANLTIKTINTSAGEFEEGIYDPNKDEIDIYQFDTRQRLFRVLAHELGHSLGLSHNNNPKSIMYAYNVGENESLSLDDISALKTRCNILP
jgi:predicted Zn-dependent protease